MALPALHDVDMLMFAETGPEDVKKSIAELFPEEGIEIDVEVTSSLRSLVAESCYSGRNSWTCWVRTLGMQHCHEWHKKSSDRGPKNDR